MSSVTRVGFVVPDVTDFADEIIYFDNNITTYENELPSALAGSLPGSGNYNGRVRTTAQAAGTFSPAKPYNQNLYNSAWTSQGSAGIRNHFASRAFPDNSTTITASGTEIFSAAMGGFSSLSLTAGALHKFICQFHLDFYNASGGSAIFNGKFNIFLNPGSAVQPTPTTPGAVRLSFPIVESDNTYLPFEGTNPTTNNTAVDYFYGEMFYVPSATETVGVGVYLSSTLGGVPDWVVDPTTIVGGTFPFDGYQITVETARVVNG